jgi:imidazolonepropionase-like amidohydrolase
MHLITRRARHVSALAALLTLGLTAGWASTGHAQATAGVTALEGARVIVGDGRAALDNATIVVSGGRIEQVGAADTVRVPAGATRVNLAGKTVMPTIIDTHTHLGLTRDDLTRDLRQRAYFGVSAALSMGLDRGDEPFQIRAQVPAGAARYFLAGRGITMPEPGRSDVPYWVTTEAESRKAVQEQAALKVDLIKIWVDDRDGKYKKLPPEFYTAIIDEAHKHGLRVAAHIFNLSDAKGLLKAGIDAFAHGIRDVDVDDELIALVKARPNVVLIPNMPDRGVAVDYGWLSGSVPEAELKKLQAGATDRPPAQATFGIQARNLDKLAKAGMTITVGTDGNTPWAPHVEMADMVASGMTPAQVIVAATKNGAAFLKMADAGTIEVGKTADLLVLDADPLQDITNTRKISAVYLHGVAVDRQAMRATAGRD